MGYCDEKLWKGIIFSQGISIFALICTRWGYSKWGNKFCMDLTFPKGIFDSFYLIQWKWNYSINFWTFWKHLFLISFPFSLYMKIFSRWTGTCCRIDPIFSISIRKMEDNDWWDEWPTNSQQSSRLPPIDHRREVVGSDPVLLLWLRQLLLTFFHFSITCANLNKSLLE